MADNNKNPRRTIWLSETEPLSHYDIWLSKNKHLNASGESVLDSGVLRDCDYIFKVWDCNNWHPIVGLNSTALNKIDTVLNTGYTDSNEEYHYSYEEFHLPLFTKEDSSPSELFDAGTLGLAIKKYVTGIEWLQIFGGNNIDINTFINPAGLEYLGGIWADEFQIEDMFPDSEAHDSHSQTEINDSYNWIALAKYKLNHGTSDYNLYVSAKDVVGAINHYQTENPEAPGIQPSNDFEWRLANTEQIGGIKAGVHNNYTNAFKPVECKFYPDYESWSSIHERLCINAHDVIDSIIESFSDPNENWLFGNHGITIGLQLGGNRIEWAIDGLGVANNGQYARCKVTEGINRHSIEWVDLPEQQEYSILSSSDHNNGPYVINGCNESSAAKFFLNGEGGWTEINSGLSELIEGNGFNTFVLDNKIYIGAYSCVIQANDFTLDTSVLINVNGSYSNNHYPLTSFVDYLVEHQNGISRIKIESDNQVYLPYPSYMHFTTSDTKCTFIFPQTMEFIETKSVNSLSGEDYYYTDADYYIVELKAETKYNVTFYKNCIKFETNSNSIFEQQLTDET